MKRRDHSAGVDAIMRTWFQAVATVVVGPGRCVIAAHESRLGGKGVTWNEHDERQQELAHEDAATLQLRREADQGAEEHDARADAPLQVAAGLKACP